ncbi:EpsG family protein [Chryseobacterium sp.]|uniref:EpsG family protein n=1 Tax=Chryseobacterium sp. TaxID=1871047 RepID=UPI0025BAB8C8|nr:EpsG family protein [Chryseobacterium sp.]
MYYIIFLSILSLCLFESIFERNKFKNVFFIITGLLLFIIQSFNTWAPDLDAYKIQFNYIDKDFVRQLLEPVHVFLIEIVKNNSGHFNDFIFLYGVLIMIPFLYFIKKSSPLPVFVLSVFFILPFFPDITQIRNFLAFAVFFLALRFFHTNKIIFYSLYVLSIFCHYSLLVMAVFFIFRKLPFYNNTRKNNLIILIGVLILIVTPKSIASTIVVSVNAKYDSYLEGTNTYIGTIVLFLPFFILNSFVLYHYRKNKDFIENVVSDEYKKFIPLYIELITYANYLILFQYFIRDFSRITMNLSVLSYIYLSILLFYGYSKNSTKWTGLCLRYGIYTWALFTFYILFLLLNNGEYLKIIENTFSSNRLYG